MLGCLHGSVMQWVPNYGNIMMMGTRGYRMGTVCGVASCDVRGVRSDDTMQV